MQKAWNKEGKYFGQSYEETDVLDSAVLIMPLVFFMHGVSRRPSEIYLYHILTACYNKVRPKVRDYLEADTEDTGEGRFNVKRACVLSTLRARLTEHIGLLSIEPRLPL